MIDKDADADGAAAVEHDVARVGANGDERGLEDKSDRLGRQSQDVSIAASKAYLKERKEGGGKETSAKQK